MSLYLWFSFDSIDQPVFVKRPFIFCYHSCVVELEIREDNTSGISLIVQYRFSYHGNFIFPWEVQFVFAYEVQYYSFKICKELSWDFNLDFIESIGCFLQNVHFYYVNPNYLWTCEIFPSSDIFSNSFFSDLGILSCMSLTCLLKVTPWYFLLFVDIMIGIVSLISFSSLLSSVYKRITNFLS